MRRFLVVPAVLALLLLSLAIGMRRAAPALAITYPAGWNLVSGPGGSTLVGATGSLYTLQAGDTSYEALPPDSVLRAGWGYWAYFPNGGSLLPGPEAASYATILSPGGWSMLGNPSATAPATVSGADAVLVYTADGGYQAATSIPPGAGAFVAGAASVTVGIPGAPPVAPPTATPAPVPLGLPALIAAGLQSSDLPGYTSLGATGGTPTGGAIAVYSTSWRDLRVGTPHYSVAETLAIYSTPLDATRAVEGVVQAILISSQYTTERDLGSVGIGSQDRELSFIDPSKGPGIGLLDGYLVVFRHGDEVVVVITLDQHGSGSLAVAEAYARLIDARLSAALGE